MEEGVNNTSGNKVDRDLLQELYVDSPLWEVNTGQQTIHAKRLPGRYRNLKWLGSSLYLFFFLGPYLRWGDRQAILFDIPNRKYHIFSVTFWPQDIWMLAVLLLSFFITLFVVTALAGRVFCGYICWQTVWTDVFTWFEEKFEGPPHRRKQLDAAPWSFRKFRIKFLKHSVWIAIGALTGITFTAYFIDVFELWSRYFSFQGPRIIWLTPVPFLIGIYIGVGFLREQVCFWLCPYGRIQGVMTDLETVLPTYDYDRGEPRTKLRDDKSETDSDQGDCVMCNLCVGVCPTGIDIRMGQQEGCITCGLCIDACDTVMEKVQRPKGLIRYASLNGIFGVKEKPISKRPRVIVYALILTLAWSGVIYGITHISPINMTLIHERQPLFVRMSDGSIQNKYTVKVLNKTSETLDLTFLAKGLEHPIVQVIPQNLSVAPGLVGSANVLIKVTPETAPRGKKPIVFHVYSTSHLTLKDRYESMFVGPKTP